VALLSDSAGGQSLSTNPRNELTHSDGNLIAPGAFGLAIDSDAGLPGLDIPGAVAGSRSVKHRLVDAAAIRERCGPDMLKQVRLGGTGVDHREYHEHASGGDLIRTVSYGEHLIADGGRTVLSAVEGVRKDRWQRFVLGQVLPATAGIQGLEIFHASAVSVNGGLLAFAGNSGVGKSTLAGVLIEAGATFFADDVLAVDVTISGTMGYPGIGLMALPLEQIEQYGLEKSVWMTVGEKGLLKRHGERSAQPLKAFVAMVPDESVEKPQFLPCAPNRLMASTFDALSRGPERLRRLLRVCASLASDSRAFELRFSSRSEPAAIADAIAKRLDLEVGS
jgi:hypothetical protein